MQKKKNIFTCRSTQRLKIAKKKKERTREREENEHTYLSFNTRISSIRYNKLLFNSNFSIRIKSFIPSTRFIKLKPSSNLSKRTREDNPVLCVLCVLCDQKEQ